MVGVVAGLLTSGVVKIASDKISSAIAGQAGLMWNFTKDLEDMKVTMESMTAVLKDAEKQSFRNESVRLWLKRLKDAALDIFDMMDDYQDTDAQPTAKMPGVFSSCLTAARKKMVLAKKMKNMREKLERINKERQNFTFTGSNATSQDQQLNGERETASDVKEEAIVGRDREKKDITECLSSNHRKDGVMFLPIYGLGGMGKTTLAQLVYSNTQFIEFYDHRAWVYVSQEFDLKKIGRSIISQISKDRGGQENLDTLQLILQCLNDLLLLGKKILIVLDDIWEEDDFKLKKLKDMLDKEGSMVDVIVTTRSQSIANNICTNQAYHLQPLDDNMCWDIIKRNSEFDDKINKGELERVGLDIAKKCAGVALAAHALGYMLKSKNLDGWREVNNSDIWNESSGVDTEHNRVLPSLMLSYERMLPILRICFSYCAIFPKGHDIYEDNLVYQWVALDFIKKPSEGKEYIKQLLGMSFLQHSKLPVHNTRMRYTMHDLVHDLARSVMGDELIVIDAAAEKSPNTSQRKYCRYAELTNYYGQITKLSNILPKKVRALHISDCKTRGYGYDVGSLSFPRCLRILDFSGCNGIPLPSSIGQLNQLKCLIATEVLNKRQPESIPELSRLQHLNLRRPERMSALPESIGKLSRLIYLCLSNCSDILELPEVLFGGLESLVHLDISNCSGITVLPESLGGLKSLVRLNISSCPKLTVLPESLGELKSLVRLNMSHSKIIVLPESLGGLKNLVHLDMSCCSKITVLPESFGGLKSLVRLNMSSCSGITILPESFGGLKSLVRLNMSSCSGITILPESFGGLKSLVHLDMSRCSEITVLPKSLGGLESLVHLDMSRCSKIVVLPESFGGLKSLVHLFLFSCKEITALPKSIGHLTNLQVLCLSYCSKVKEIPEFLGGLSQLKLLNLSYCDSITSLPECISELTALKSLFIEGCSDELKDQASSKLHYSQILPDFKVRADDMNACSNLSLLEDVNVPELRIWSLENVRFPEEAHKVKLSDKSKLSRLTLGWTLHADRFLDDKNLLGQLVPPRGLEHLNLKGYSSQSFPNGLTSISNFVPNLVGITLDSCPNLSSLPESIRHLRSLKSLELVCCEMISVLPEWMGDLSSLRWLSIQKCSGIKSLPPCIQLTELWTLRITGNPELQRWCESEENRKKLGPIYVKG